MLASLKTLLQDAQKKRYAVGAFNVLNLEYIVGLVEASELEKAPIILQISTSIISLFGLETILKPCLFLGEMAKTPICVHLDHGKSRNDITKAMDAGFNSVMFDGSSLPLSENSKETSYLAKLAHEKGISIEAEIGKVGKEEDGECRSDLNLQLTDVSDVQAFVEETQVDALAVSIGSIHGVKLPHINLEIDLLKEIKSKISTPLVLHGSSGVNDSSILLAIESGITKINVATRLQVKVAEKLYHISKCNGDSYMADSKFISSTIIESVRNEAINKIKLFNSIRTE
jgi:fructose-bisphosphate aldolase class II